MSRAVRRNSSLALVAVAMWAGSTGAPAADWLSLGSKHWAPTVTSKTGIGTANAAAEAKVTREEITGWCANWSPGDADCAKRELASAEAKKTYRATADCTRGRITAVDGNTYTLAGMWDNSDIGGGRSKWRDASGKIVGRDNASGGLGISQQWEVLCPGPIKKAPGAARLRARRPARKPHRPRSSRSARPSRRSTVAIGCGVELTVYSRSRGRAGRKRSTTFGSSTASAAFSRSGWLGASLASDSPPRFARWRGAMHAYGDRPSSTVS